jgi:hypothetical protein
LAKSNITVADTHPTSLFPQLKLELEGRHFEVIEAESRMVLNTFTEHEFCDAFKNGRSAGNDACARKRDYFEGNCVQQAQS